MERGSKLVYLAGPITGVDYGGCTDWRKYAKAELAKSGIIGVSPMRGKENLANEKKVADCYVNDIFSCQRGIITRDRWDTMRCDLFLANLLGAKKVSIGTVMEFAWADSQRIPVIAIMEKQGNLHDHSMIREATGFRVETLDDGLLVAKALLTY